MALLLQLLHWAKTDRRAAWRGYAKKTLKATLAIIAIHASTSAAAFADGSITIGTPNDPGYNLAADLQSAYQKAVQNGYTTINLNPGTYYTFITQPIARQQPAIPLQGWHDVTINGQGSTIRDENTTNNNNMGGYYNSIFYLFSAAT